MSTSPRTITRAVQLVFDMRDVLGRQPISADDLAVELGMKNRTARAWLRSLQQLHKVKPVGVTPLKPRQHGSGALLWSWVGE